MPIKIQGLLTISQAYSSRWLVVSSLPKLNSVSCLLAPKKLEIHSEEGDDQTGVY